MWLMLVNSLILLFAISLPITGLFWKYFSKSTGESARAAIATVISMFGLALFFIQVAIMTAIPNENAITMLIQWLNTRF